MVAGEEETVIPASRIAGSRRRASAIALVAFVVLAGTYGFFAGTAPGRAVEVAIMGQDVDGAWEPPVWVLILAVNPLTIAIATLAIIIVAAREGRRSAAVLAVIAIGGSTGSALALESALVARDPLGAEALRELGAGFYPSGHAAAIVSITLSALIALPAHQRRRRIGVAAASAAVLGCAVYSTRWHHPSDVVGGFAVAAGWVFAALAAYPSAAARGSRAWGRDPAATWSPALWTARLVVVAAIGAPFLAALQAVGLPTGPLQPLLLLSWCAIAICAIALTAAMQAAALPQKTAPAAATARALADKREARRS